MKKLLASKGAKLIGSVLTDLLPLGTTVKTGIQTSIEGRHWFKLIMWGACALGIVATVIAFLMGSIEMHELEEVIDVLNELSHKH